ncbi:arginine--tRNA ligase [Patescibacteria group bacterium]|nr:MAG: arginine--tRNA ligase [Patescibacteria group bacterium]
MDKKIIHAVRELYGAVDVEPKLTRPDAQFGDYSTNVAMQLAASLGKNPREIAEQLAITLRGYDEFKQVDVAGPGFLNIWLSDSVLSNDLEAILTQGSSYGKPNTYQDKVVVTEYSDPNPFKVLHAGHLYTSIIGDAISNLIEYAGGTVHRVNFGGDVGMHVAKTMWAILKRLGGENPAGLDDIAESDRSEWMAASYVEGTNAYEEDDVAKAEIVALNKKVYQIHADNDHESPLAQIYWTCRTWSYDYFNAFYDRINTHFEKYYPESETAPTGLATVLEQKDQGVYQESQGAVVFVGEPYDLHTRVFINSEGLPTYEAKDVGLSIKKWADYHFDESIIITGNDITEYMKVVLKSIEQFLPELARRTKHFTHGNVKLAGGVKMSSRKGNFLRAVDVLDIAADENEKAQGNRDDAPVLGAVKYAFLKNRIGPDIIFDPKESVSIVGNSGPYLQYAHARAVSIVEKSTVEESNNLTHDFDDYERSLLVKMTEYSDVIASAVNELSPHLVCTYLYELAQVFNRFYEKSHVLGDAREAIRVRLVTAYAGILKNGLTVLGIPAPDKL